VLCRRPGVAIADARLEEVSDGIYAYVQPDGSWWINNTGFFVGRRGVVSVDACSTERRTRAYLDAIASVTDQPVRTLINTHHHGDHTYGNYLCRRATIVAHEQCREQMRAFGPPGAARSGPRSTGVASSWSSRSSPTRAASGSTSTTWPARSGTSRPRPTPLTSQLFGQARTR
jgi:glyoxylase-like metal-dependent hydrolase (beta-lactamase superfamily II)